MKRFVIGLATLLMGGVTACESVPTGSTASQPTAMAERTVGEYRLGAADQLRVTVFGEPELSGEYVLDGTGTVSLPLVGEVPALNLTVREFQRAVEARYADGYLREPRINAEVLNYRPFVA